MGKVDINPYNIIQKYIFKNPTKYHENHYIFSYYYYTYYLIYHHHYFFFNWTCIAIGHLLIHMLPFVNYLVKLVLHILL